jgi:hypothetical protein
VFVSSSGERVAISPNGFVSIVAGLEHSNETVSQENGPLVYLLVSSFDRSGLHKRGRLVVGGGGA